MGWKSICKNRNNKEVKPAKKRNDGEPPARPTKAPALYKAGNVRESCALDKAGCEVIGWKITYQVFSRAGLKTTKSRAKATNGKLLSKPE
jgi:hypothetical protein